MREANGKVMTAFLILFLLGLLLTYAGGIITTIDSFRVSPGWGFLCLASLLLIFPLFILYWVKFWNRKWARNGLWVFLAGMASSLISLPFLGNFIAQTFEQAIDAGSIQIEEPTAEGEGQADVGVSPDGEGDPAAGTEAPPTGNGELFQESFLPGLPTASQIALAELLPSTDANERLKEITSDRPDPFAIVQVPPPPKPAPPAPSSTPGTGVGQLPGGVSAPGGGTTPGGGGSVTGGGGSGNANPGGSSPGGAVPEPGSGTIKPLPNLPNPLETAAQVQVTGVVKVNGNTFAIVKAPGEPTSRYVKVGDRISNGAVLVKRIDTPAGKDPFVVFEERGVELAIPVGSNVGKPEESSMEAQATVSVPEVASLPILP